MQLGSHTAVGASRHTLVQMPLVGKVASCAAPELMSERQAEFRRPFRDGLKRDGDAAQPTELRRREGSAGTDNRAISHGQ